MPFNRSRRRGPRQALRRPLGPSRPRPRRSRRLACSACSATTAPARPPRSASSRRSRCPTDGQRARRRPRRGHRRRPPLRERHRPRRPVGNRRRPADAPAPTSRSSAGSTTCREAGRAAPGGRAARAARAHRRRRQARQDLLRRHAAAARSRRQPDRDAAGPVPRRAHDRPRPAEPQRPLGARCASLSREGATLVLTTQYLEEADRLADDIVVLDHGRSPPRARPPSSRRRIGGERIAVTVGRRRRPAARPAAALAPFADGPSRPRRPSGARSRPGAPPAPA